MVNKQSELQAIAAAEVAIGLAIVFSIARNRKSTGCTQCVRACPTYVLEMIPWDGCKAKQIASSPRTEDCVNEGPVIITGFCMDLSWFVEGLRRSLAKRDRER
ncbi:hypothetical protein RYX36_035685 [Vicia faba]